VVDDVGRERARPGFAVGELSAGDLWLKNGNGVVLHLKAERTGLALSASVRRNF